MNEDFKKALLLWGVISFIFAILFVIENDSKVMLEAGFFAKLFAIIFGTGLGLLGAMLGDAIRRFAIPDGFMTTGGIFSIIKTKIFWMVGPQIIGLVFGVIIGEGLVLQ